MSTDHFEVATVHNRIIVYGHVSTQNARNILAAIHSTTHSRGYKDIVLDFQHCKSVFSPTMLALVSQILRLRGDGIDVDLTLPEENRLARLFKNSNWAHLIAPQYYEASAFRGHTQVPTILFRDSDEQYNAVNKLLNVILAALSGFSRSHLSAIEWSVNEITDNVINHSNSNVGGVLQLSSFSRNRKAVEYVVCDAGVGIPKTLREGHPDISTDTDALDRAIREGVTRDTHLGQGNGLYGSWRITQLSGGNFEIHSGYASLTTDPKTGVHVRKEAIPFNGTLVFARINYDRPLVLQEALRFRDLPQYQPVDYIEARYENRDNALQFDLAKETKSFGSRAAGAPIRQKLLNLSQMCQDKKIIIDLSKVALLSSSFADEVFGKLFLEVGPIEFSSRFELKGLDQIVKSIIDKSIAQRLSVGSGGAS